MKNAFRTFIFGSLMVTTVAFAGGSIVPGESMGEVKLGITSCEEARTKDYNFNLSVECTDGVVSRAQTNTGGTVWVDTDQGRLMIGLVTAPAIIRIFGDTFEAHFETEYPQSVAYWLVYRDKGIAFRVLYLDKGDLQMSSPRSGLQSIMVFKVK